MKNKESIFFGGITKEQYEQNFYKMTAIELALNEHLNLSNYGSGLEKIYFVPMAIPPENKIHEESIKYTGRKKKVRIQLRLNLERLNTVPEFLQQVAELFYQSISKFKKHRVKNFDIAAFQKDVGELFTKHGWLAKEVAC